MFLRQSNIVIDPLMTYHNSKFYSHTDIKKRGAIPVTLPILRRRKILTKEIGIKRIGDRELSRKMASENL